MPQDWFSQFEARPATPSRPSAPEPDWFDQFVVQQPTHRTTNARHPDGRVVVDGESDRSTIADLAIGAGKGVLNTAVGLGELVHRIPGVSRAVDTLYGTEGLSERAFTDARERVQPSNTPQRIGFGVEQVGEFFTPVGQVGRATRLGRAAVSGAHALVQSGSPGAAVTSGALTAVLPGAGAAQRASKTLRDSAEKEVVRALGPTKEWAKDEAARLAPEMLTRGVKGSREALLEQAKSKVKSIGQQLDAEYATLAQQGTTVNGQLIRGAINLSEDALKVRDASGTLTVIPGTERVVQRLQRLEAFVQQLGNDIPIDKAAHVKRTLDKLVSKAGLFNQKAGASATDNAEAWATREASNAFRDLINRNASVDALNAELSFWIPLKNVLKETQKRTQAQSGGLVQGVMGSTGAAAGFASGDSMTDRAQNAVLGGLVGRQFVALVQSPAFRTRATAPMKQLLADALASGQTGQLLAAMSKITAALPGQMRPAGVTP
jgi:hypothetical protein